MLCIGSEHEYLMATHEDAVYPHALSPPNAGPEWQAGRVRGGSRLPLKACPLNRPDTVRLLRNANATSMIRANEGSSSRRMRGASIFAIRSNHQVSDYRPLHQPQPSRNLPFSARGVRPMVLGHSSLCTTTGLSYFPTLASDVAGTARRPNSLTTLLKSPSKIPYTNPEKLK